MHYAGERISELKLSGFVGQIKVRSPTRKAPQMYTDPSSLSAAV